MPGARPGGRWPRPLGSAETTDPGTAAWRAAVGRSPALLILASAQFLMTLDSSVMNVSLQSVASDLHTTVTGIQNTFTNFGASLGTALVGAVLIGSLTTTFVAGVSSNPAVPASVVSEASTSLEAGIPFVSDADLQKQLATTSLSPEARLAIVDENVTTRLVGLRVALSVVALVIVVAMFFARMLPTESLSGAAAGVRRRRRRHRGEPTVRLTVATALHPA